MIIDPSLFSEKQNYMMYGICKSMQNELERKRKSNKPSFTPFDRNNF